MGTVRQGQRGRIPALSSAGARSKWTFVGANDAAHPLRPACSSHGPSEDHNGQVCDHFPIFAIGYTWVFRVRFGWEDQLNDGMKLWQGEGAEVFEKLREAEQR